MADISRSLGFLGGSRFLEFRLPFAMLSLRRLQVRMRRDVLFRRFTGWISGAVHGDFRCRIVMSQGRKSLVHFLIVLVLGGGVVGGGPFSEAAYHFPLCPNWLSSGYSCSSALSRSCNLWRINTVHCLKPSVGSFRPSLGWHSQRIARRGPPHRRM